MSIFERMREGDRFVVHVDKDEGSVILERPIKGKTSPWMDMQNMIGTSEPIGKILFRCHECMTLLVDRLIWVHTGLRVKLDRIIRADGIDLLHVKAFLEDFTRSYRSHLFPERRLRVVALEYVLCRNLETPKPVIRGSGQRVVRIDKSLRAASSRRSGG